MHMQWAFQRADQFHLLWAEYYQRVDQTRLILTQWMNVVASKKRIQQLIIHWFVAYRVKSKQRKVIESWKEYIVQKKKLQVRVIEKWKQYQSDYHIAQYSIGYLLQKVYNTISTQSIQKTVSHWISYVRETCFRRQMIVRRCFLQWRRHIELVKGSGKRIKQHKRVLFFQFNIMCIHFCIRVLVPCIIYTSQHLASPRVYLTQANVFLRRLLAFTNEHNSFSTGDIILRHIDFFVRLTQIGVYLHGDVKPKSSYLVFFDILRKSLTQHCKQIKELETFLLPSLIPDVLCCASDVRLHMVLSEFKEWQTVEKVPLLCIGLPKNHIKNIIEIWLTLKKPKSLLWTFNQYRFMALDVEE